METVIPELFREPEIDFPSQYFSTALLTGSRAVEDSNSNVRCSPVKSPIQMDPTNNEVIGKV